MKTTHECIARGLAAVADRPLNKLASRRWLEDSDLVKLCELFKESRKKNKKKKGRTSRSSCK